MADDSIPSTNNSNQEQREDDVVQPEENTTDHDHKENNINTNDSGNESLVQDVVQPQEAPQNDRSQEHVDDDDGSHASPRPQENEYCTEQDLIENGTYMEHKDDTADDHAEKLRWYRELPSKVYLEKTNVTSAVTLALQALTEKRPSDPIDFVARFLIQHNAKLKEPPQSQPSSNNVDMHKSIESIDTTSSLPLITDAANPPSE